MQSWTATSGYAKGLLKQATYLAAAADMDAGGAECARDVQVRKIMARVAELVRGASALGREPNAVALGVLSRTIIEALISLLWVEISEENAQHQAAAGLAEFKRVARVNLERGHLKIHKRDDGTDATAGFLDSNQFRNIPKSKKVFDMAKEAGVDHLYEVVYRFMSMATHGHELGDAAATEESVVIDMQAIGALGTAIGHAGVRWLIHRERTDNETLRKLLGIAD